MLSTNQGKGGSDIFDLKEEQRNRKGGLSGEERRHGSFCKFEKEKSFFCFARGELVWKKGSLFLLLEQKVRKGLKEKGSIV